MTNDSDHHETEPEFQHDPAFKNLFIDFSKETITWLLPKLIETYGPLAHVAPLRQEQQKRWLSDEGRELDVPLLCTFKNKKLIITLIEHQSSKKAFNIFKLAHYTLDLMESNPTITVIPIVVFADQTKWRSDVPCELINEALGQEWMRFRFHRVKLKDFKARDMLKSSNPVVQIMIMNFDYESPEKVSIMKDALLHLWNSVTAQHFYKYFDFLNKYGKLSELEHEQLMSEIIKEPDGMTLTEAFTQKGLEKGLEKGREEGIEIQKKTLLNILLVRFGDAQSTLADKINQITSEDLLSKLIVSAATINSIDEFDINS